MLSNQIISKLSKFYIWGKVDYFVTKCFYKFQNSMIMQSVRRFTSVIKTKLRNVWNPKVPFSSNAPSRPINMAYSLFTSTSASSDAPPLLIMHGLFGSKKNWRSMSKALQTKFIPNRQVKSFACIVYENDI